MPPPPPSASLFSCNYFQLPKKTVQPFGKCQDSAASDHFVLSFDGPLQSPTHLSTSLW